MTTTLSTAASGNRCCRFGPIPHGISRGGIWSVIIADVHPSLVFDRPIDGRLLSLQQRLIRAREGGADDGIAMTDDRHGRKKVAGPLLLSALAHIALLVPLSSG